MSSDRIKKNIKIATKRKKKVGKISETMEGFYFIISVSGHNMPNAGEDDDCKSRK
jgi:hypothetical protein